MPSNTRSRNPFKGASVSGCSLNIQRTHSFTLAYIASTAFSLRRSVKPQLGFTLLELMVTVAIGAIVMSLAIPGMVTMVQNGRQSAQVSSLLYSLDYARSEAIKRDTWVQVCATTDGKTCDNTVTNWNNGWLVVSAPAQTPAYPALLSVPALSNNNTLTATQSVGVAQVTSTPTFVQFEGNGTLSSVTPITVNFRLCDSRGGPYARAIQVLQLGRVQASPNIGYSLTTPSTALVCP